MRQTSADQARDIRWTPFHFSPRIRGHCRRSSTAFTHSPTHAAKRVTSQRLCTTSKPGHHPEAGKGDYVDCDISITYHNEQKRYTNDRRVHLGALSVMITWQAVTKRTTSPRTETLSGRWAAFVSHPCTTWRRNWLHQRWVESNILNDSVLEDDKCDVTKLSNFLTKIHRTEYRAYSGLTPSPIVNFSSDATTMATIMQIRWRRITHVMWREQNYTTRTALHGTLEKKRKRWRPNSTWHPSLEEEKTIFHQTWSFIQ